MYLTNFCNKQYHLRTDSLPKVWAHFLWSVLQGAGKLRESVSDELLQDSTTLPSRTPA